MVGRNSAVSFTPLYTERGALGCTWPGGGPPHPSIVMVVPVLKKVERTGQVVSCRTSWESLLPFWTPFQLQETFKGWPFCFLIRQSKLLHWKIQTLLQGKEDRSLFLWEASLSFPSPSSHLQASCFYSSASPTSS